MEDTVTGYHGTSRTIADEILANGFQPSHGRGHWLGDGIYLFERGFGHAQAWASAFYAEGDACVIRATVDLRDCLDLTDRRGAELLAPFYSKFEALYGPHAIEALHQAPDQPEWDCAVLNFACESLAEDKMIIRSVRQAFLEGKPIATTVNSSGPVVSKYYERAQVQLCVRDAAVILGVQDVSGVEE